MPFESADGGDREAGTEDRSEGRLELSLGDQGLGAWEAPLAAWEVVSKPVVRLGGQGAQDGSVRAEGCDAEVERAESDHSVW